MDRSCFSVPSRRFGWSALLLGGLFLSFAIPSRAVIIAAGASAEENLERKRASHAEGAGQTCVVAVLVCEDDPESKLPLESRRSVSSGVFVGADPEGKTGYILTAATQFLVPVAFGQKPPSKAVKAVFGPSVQAKDAVTVEIRRIILHPGLESEGKNTRDWDADTLHNNLAMLEFDLRAQQDALVARKVQPAVLCDEWGDTRSGQDAKVLGFGRFGFNTSPELDAESLADPGVHAGDVHCTYAAFGSDSGREGEGVFLSHVPLTLGGS